MKISLEFCIFTRTLPLVKLISINYPMVLWFLNPWSVLRNCLVEGKIDTPWYFEWGITIKATISDSTVNRKFFTRKTKLFLSPKVNCLSSLTLTYKILNEKRSIYFLMNKFFGSTLAVEPKKHPKRLNQSVVLILREEIVQEYRRTRSTNS